MKRIMTYLAVAVCTAMMLTACSKDKKYERWLKKGTGEWTTNTVKVESYKADTLHSVNNYDTPRKVVFDENGVFSMATYTDASLTTVISNSLIAGEWTNTKDDILVTDVYGNTLVIKIHEISKKNLKLEYKDGVYDGSYDVTTLSLTKTD